MVPFRHCSSTKRAGPKSNVWIFKVPDQLGNMCLIGCRRFSQLSHRNTTDLHPNKGVNNVLVHRYLKRHAVKPGKQTNWTTLNPFSDLPSRQINSTQVVLILATYALDVKLLQYGCIRVCAVCRITKCCKVQLHLLFTVCRIPSWAPQMHVFSLAMEMNEWHHLFKA